MTALIPVHPTPPLVADQTPTRLLTVPDEPVLTIHIPPPPVRIVNPRHPALAAYAPVIATTGLMVDTYA